MNNIDIDKEIVKMTKRIRIANGEIPADFVIKNAKIINVYTHEIIDGDIAFSDGMIAATGSYSGEEEFDAGGKFALPGFIDSHIHIESSMTTPEEFCRMMVPHGTTTVIADPHEIVNVCGLTGLEYMIAAADKVPMDIRYMMPSCVPSTDFEDAGAIVKAEDMISYFESSSVLGLGEFMDSPGVINANKNCLKKIIAAESARCPVDGHSPSVAGKNLQAYITSGIKTDHECANIPEMIERIRSGMYVQLRNGSACRNLSTLIKGVSDLNSRRCLLCSDDRQPISIFKEGDIDGMLRIAVNNGINPITAIQMATLNAAECYHLEDRGAIAPMKKGDIILVRDLEKFEVSDVFIDGRHIASGGEYLGKIERHSISEVKGSVHIDRVQPDDFKLKFSSRQVNIIDMIPEEVVTKKSVATVNIADDGDFIFDQSEEICKISVIARHKTGSGMSTALIRGYGIDYGAVAMTIAHDSHNIIVAGTNNEDMAFAVNTLSDNEGGIVMVRDEKVVESMPLPVAGLMSDQSGEWVAEKLQGIHRAAIEDLGVSTDVDPIMTLCFMALPVIPEIKITNRGLFDVNEWKFIDLENTNE